MIASSPLEDRLLLRATFGPRPGERAAIRREGAEVWLARQLAPDSISDREAERRLEAFPQLGAPLGSLTDGLELREGGRARGAGLSKEERAERRRLLRALGAHAAGARVVRAVYGPRDLHEVMIDFWANHFSVSLRKGLVGAFLSHYERETLRRHALGRFEDLLLAVARSPAMLVYLDNWRSSVVRGFRRGGQSGGINENYARELLELHTLGLGGGYTQHDVVEVARVFTGWTLRNRRGPAFAFRSRMHDRGDKLVLGRRIAASGVDEGEALLRRLARHPSTARHVSGRLARRFVSDAPPARLVERVARTFLRTEGSIPHVLREIFLAPEFTDEESRKLKTPLELFASALRATGGETDGSLRALKLLGRLGEAPFSARSPAGFPDEAARWGDAGSMLRRLELPFVLARGRRRGTRLGDALPELGGPQSSRLRAVPPRERVAVALASPEFQWQ
jgi:uncharacterized protein (DUF1800 family)